MTEKTKRETESRKRDKKQSENFPAEQESLDDENVWSKDQQQKSYYYDDGYGYEIYNAEEEDDDDANDTK